MIIPSELNLNENFAMCVCVGGGGGHKKFPFLLDTISSFTKLIFSLLTPLNPDPNTRMIKQAKNRRKSCFSAQSKKFKQIVVGSFNHFGTGNINFCMRIKNFFRDSFYQHFSYRID